MMFNLFKKNVNMKEVGQNKALTWSCYGVKSRITSIMEGKWTDNGTIVCPDWCGHSNSCDRALGITGTALRKIAAVFCLLTVMGVGNVFGYEFSLVTSVSELEEGSKVIFLNAAGDRAMGSPTADSNKRTEISEITFDDGKVVTSDSDPITIFKIETEDILDTTYYLFKDGSDYLYGAGGKSNNHLRTGTKASAGTKADWSISINASNEATVTSKGDTKIIKYSGGSNKWFSCYASGQSAIKLYRCTSPYLYVVSDELSSFGYAVGYGPSLAQAVSVKGYNLTGDLTVSAPTNYEVCSTVNGTYASSITLTAVSNKVNATFYVRLAAGKSANTYNETLRITGGGITEEDISLTGSVIAVPASSTGFNLITNAVDIYPDDSIVILNATGTRLLTNEGTNNRKGAYPSGNFTLIGGTVFTSNSSDSIQKIKIEGCDNEWLMKVGDDSYFNASSSGSNNLTTVSFNNIDNNAKWKISTNADFNDTIIAIGSNTRNWIWYNGNNTSVFSCYSGSGTKRELPKIYAKPSATANVCGWPSGLTGFLTKSGTASAAQSFSVKARNISSGNVTVTAPTGYEVCLTADGTYASSVTITPVSNSVAPTTIYVRIAYATGAGDCNGNIAISATGATTRNIALTGSVTPLTVTYHSVTGSDHVVNVSYNGSVDAYTPAELK